jgi:hypothetical protein
MDIGDWQELARLRSENHLWHRCMAEIVDALDPTTMSTQTRTLHETVVQSVAVLDHRLTRLGRRPVSTER